jgi:hypothetical protein
VPYTIQTQVLLNKIANFTVKGRVCLLTELNVKLQNEYAVIKRKDHNIQVTSLSSGWKKIIEQTLQDGESILSTPGWRNLTIPGKQTLYS